ncbi:MAG: glycine--tRNA ligase subunit beta [Gammaproteobacteria bacterium]|nr:glycine--tRNA ligase subunit beta [Gammaproteobacteria bacterium]
MSATKLSSLLIEIGTEELPPLALPALSSAFAEGIQRGFKDLGFSEFSIETFATPRRLAVLLKNVPLQQPDQKIERRGPPAQAAFDKDGKPTKAAEAFAQSCGVSIEKIQRLKTDKGEYLYYEATQAGAATTECVAAIVQTSLDALPIPKRMRWGSGNAEFVRPVKWLVLLFGEQIIPATILGVTASNQTFGHRFYNADAITLKHADDYEKILADAKVIANFAKRRDAIQQQVQTAATTVGGNIRWQQDSDLLNEVTALVEWPSAVSCQFETHFLAVPAEALVSTMKTNQRYFAVYDAQDKLTAHFITVANIESADVAQVRAGNERVVRPRFADAKFFFENDKRSTLAARQNKLNDIVFQTKLGSIGDKVNRMVSIALVISKTINADESSITTAGGLAKCDLLTDMVQEFPELQGIIGSYYARYDGEADEVCAAIREHYLPRFAGDVLPETKTGQALALADRIDTLLGVFSIGQQPTGSKDPFGLRRAAIGVIRIILDKKLDIDLLELLKKSAADDFKAELNARAAAEPVFDYIIGRLRAEYENDGFTPQQFEAVLACKPTRLLDFDKRMRALAAFQKLDASTSLAAANKRISNILKKTAAPANTNINVALLNETAEKNLYQALITLLPTVEPLIHNSQYEQALVQLAALREPVDAFFENVMVMADDTAVRNNRLNLLLQLKNTFGSIADISHL